MINISPAHMSNMQMYIWIYQLYLYMLRYLFCSKANSCLLSAYFTPGT